RFLFTCPVQNPGPLANVDHATGHRLPPLLVMAMRLQIGTTFKAPLAHHRLQPLPLPSGVSINEIWHESTALER
ncbi:MAG: hypothetical protein VX607_11155, partial [Planctomycetota bacterium]|nr:hypothetical protein [Planctomycetota bacterium]